MTRLLFSIFVSLFLSMCVCSGKPSPEQAKADKTPSKSHINPDELCDPKPVMAEEHEFEIPQMVMYPPRPLWRRILDVGLLTFSLALASWLVKRHIARHWLLALTVANLVYFGFIRHGCICPVGSFCNVSLVMFNPHTARIGLETALFFIIPLVFSFCFGRIFCGFVCPLGALQAVVCHKEIKMPKLLSRILGLFRYVFLILTLLFALRYFDLLICRFDPFVTLFRFSGSTISWIFAILAVSICVFIYRPYCRFVCPYGVLLGVFSWMALKPTKIKEAACVKCSICEKTCPAHCAHPPQINQYECLECGKCRQACPVDAIE